MSNKVTRALSGIFGLAVAGIKDIAILPKTFYEENIKSDNAVMNGAALGVAGLVAAAPLLATGSLAGVALVYGVCAASVAAMTAVKRDATVIGNHMPNVGNKIFRI
jgi:hypothetical protein